MRREAGGGRMMTIMMKARPRQPGRKDLAGNTQLLMVDCGGHMAVERGSTSTAKNPPADTSCPPTRPHHSFLPSTNLSNPGGDPRASSSFSRVKEQKALISGLLTRSSAGSPDSSPHRSVDSSWNRSEEPSQNDPSRPHPTLSSRCRRHLPPPLFGAVLPGHTHPVTAPDSIRTQRAPIVGQSPATPTRARTLRPRAHLQVPILPHPPPSQISRYPWPPRLLCSFWQPRPKPCWFGELLRQRRSPTRTRFFLPNKRTYAPFAPRPACGGSQN
ncbi:hypothetical protein EV126DRAFT_94484 [Verticillium dahliae]|nr:hypothetical protein EV126DRAFT_94484 [Verticillium dahliae]